METNVESSLTLSTQLPATPPSSRIVAPAVDAGEALRRWQEYQDLEAKILAEPDYIYYVLYKNGKYDNSKAFEKKTEAEAFAQQMHGTLKPRKRKSAFRKLGTFFGVTMPSELAEEEPQVEIQ